MSRRLENKARDLLSRERGTIFKEPGGRLRVCLVYPNEYSIAMSSLGFQGVYGLFNDEDDVFCERAFLPSPDEAEELERTGTPLCSLETGTPLSGFHVIAFSVAFENDYPNVLKLLEMGRIPLYADERAEKHPLVVMGGICAFSNPEPLAMFMDACLIGEAEAIVPGFLDALRAGSGRKDTVRALAGVDGVYVPSLYEVSYGPGGGIEAMTSRHGAPERVRRMFAKDISGSALRARIQTPDAEFSDMFLAEAMRGCPWSCNFCLAGHVYDPPRVKPIESLRAELAPAVREGGRVGLIAPSLSDYPHRDEALAIEGVGFSITSLRASPRSAELASMLSGHRSLTIAPEAGSERLRRAINKKITRPDILETARKLLEAGVKRLRLYFMIGLPGETLEDVEEIVGLVREIRGQSDRGRLALTVSVFVPKPHTPFQWSPMLPEQDLKERFALVRKGLRGVSGVSVSTESPRLAHAQGLLAQGDRRLAPVLEGMAHGFSAKRACREAGMSLEWYCMRQKDSGEVLPWDFIDSAAGTGQDKDRLWERARMSRAVMDGKERP